MTRFLNVPLDVSDVFLMTFMILLDSYMEPTRVGSDNTITGLASLTGLDRQQNWRLFWGMLIGGSRIFGWVVHMKLMKGGAW